MNYIYGWGLWVGAQVPNDSIPGKMDTLVTLGYNPNTGNYEFTPGAVIGGIPQDPYDATARIYISTNTDWPLQKTNGQDSILSMIDTRCVYNDWRVIQHQAGGRPLKVEITQMTYQWNVAGLQDIVFYQWEIRNSGSDTLKDVYLAPLADCDIGNESGPNADDVCWYDTTTNLAYQWQTNRIESGWTRDAGCVGLSFLQGPVATKDFTFPDSFHIYAGDTLGLTVFKVFNINIDPLNDVSQYLAMSGYNYIDSLFQPLDPQPPPGDQRFLESTGPIDIPPDSTAKVIVSAMCADLDYDELYAGHTLLAIDALRQKAINSRLAFLGMIQGTVQITLTSPTGGEVWSGAHSITWTSNGALSSDSVDIYCSRDGTTWDTVAVNQPNNGTYSWNTASVPDGMRYRISIVLHALGRLACSGSQGFIVDNPGNGTPEILIAQPCSILTSDYLWQWNAGDADGDQLFFNLFVQREGSGYWTKVAGPISSDTCNTRVWRQYQYCWNTDTMINSNFRLLVNAFDGSAVESDSTILFYQLYNQHNSNMAGLSTGHSTIPFSWYVVNQANLTGHAYEARFKPFGRGMVPFYNIYPANYTYDLWDATSSTLLWSDNPVPSFGYGPSFYYYDEGDPIYGFVPTCGDTGFKPRIANMDSMVRPTWDPSLDTLNNEHITNPDVGWACLNTPLEIRWHVTGTSPNDTLHAEVWDVDYNVQLPLDTTRLNDLSTISWMFGGTGTGYGRSIITTSTPPVTRIFMNLCGYKLYFNRGSTVNRQMTWATHPQDGDIWRLYFSGDIPPRLGDVFSFTPTGVAGGPGQPTIGRLTLAQNLPNPFARFTRIDYQLPKPGLVRLRVYNVAGQLVRTLVDGPQTAGPHAASWDGRDGNGRGVAAGVYLYQLRAGDGTLTKKMILVR